MLKKWQMMAAAGALIGMAPGSAAAQCLGACGTLGANGVVTAPTGFETYGWVSTYGGTFMGGLPGIGGTQGGPTNGSLFRTTAFSAGAGDELEFYFNYITSDGAGYADYSWARLLHAGDFSEAATLFTARTTPGGNTVPGFGMPEPEARMTPETVTITSGGPAWSPLGGSSESCWSEGCGFTDWVRSNYLVQAQGDYVLELGVTNWTDQAYDSGLAFQGATIAGESFASTPGAAEEIPVMPGIDSTPGDPENGIPPVFAFEDAISGLWYDPPASGYKFAATQGLFTGLTLPTAGFAGAVFEIFTGGSSLGVFDPGADVAFTTALNAFEIGFVGGFTVESEDANALPVQLFFEQATGNSFTMTPVLAPTSTTTPEPVSMALLGTGLAGLGAARRRRRRNAQHD